MRADTAILLCAGEGTRMNDGRTHKVCYEVAGVPAVIRSIRNFRQAGINRFVVVVGSRAEKVMQCLADEPGIIYAYQPTRNGTGSAAVCGLEALVACGCEGAVVIAMGDKIIAPDVISELREKYASCGAKAVFAVQPKEFNESGGRIVMRDGKVCGIYEKADLCLLKLGGLKNKSVESFREALKTEGLSDKKTEKLLDIAIEKGDSMPSAVRLCGMDFTADDIESGGYVNTATYITDVRTMLDALKGLSSDNAQGEIYLTDAVNKIAAEGGADIIKVERREKLLTYSTMQQLIELHSYFREPSCEGELPRASEYIDRLNRFDTQTRAKFADIYGDNEDFIQQRRTTVIALLNAFIARYGDRGVIIARAPGRVNLMGRHIEHRGGSINVLSINREMLTVAAPRDDDAVNIANTNHRFRDYSFSILQTVGLFETDNWLDYIESDPVMRIVANEKGEWVNYVRAGVLRLQLRYRGMLLRGMDMMFSGNIPMAAGLSSSSSIVVATMEAAIAVNKIDVQVKDFIHLCGEGEWLVGSRGGAGDHAAMKCGKRDLITHLEFFPFEIKESAELPPDYSIVVVDSYTQAKKSVEARDKFNQKVACYEFGLMLMRKRFPEYADKLVYFKHLRPELLGITQSRFYEMLLQIPERMTSEEIYLALPECREQIARIQNNHAIPLCYEIRSTVLYGIAECERAERCIELLKSGDCLRIGELMNISHNGDRVFKNGKLYDYSVGDAYLRRLIADLRSEDGERVAAAQIYCQPGGYACSTPTIDALVDFVLTCKDVAGAQLSGAGLGGCIIVLVKKQSAPALLAALKDNYYDKIGMPQGANVFTPVAGSGCFW